MMKWKSSDSVVRPAVHHVIRAGMRKLNASEEDVSQVLQAIAARCEDTEEDIKGKAKAGNPPGECQQDDEPKYGIEEISPSAASHPSLSCEHAT